MDFAIMTTLLLSAPALKEDPKAAPTGEWVLVRLERNGEEQPFDNTTLDCKTGLITTRLSPSLEGIVPVAFDPTPTVKQVVFHPGSPDGIRKGIYKIEGHTLLISLNEIPGAGRPTRFSSDGPNRTLWVFKRSKVSGASR
jgi:uncharacterized protein (TIGR03067 family)